MVSNCYHPNLSMVLITFISVSGALHLAGGIFSERELPMVLSDVNCIGNERRLVECEALERSCGALEDAGVVCQGLLHVVHHICITVVDAF